MTQISSRHKLTKAELEEQRKRNLQLLLGGFNYLKGPKGRGKTLGAVFNAYEIREAFGLKIIQIGTNVGLTAQFGHYYSVNEQEFVQQVIGLAEIADEIMHENPADDDVRAFIGERIREKGIMFYNAVLVGDEFSKYIAAGVRTRLSRVMLDLIQQMRHYGLTVLATSPRGGDLDVKAQTQFDWVTEPDLDPYTDILTLRWRNGGDFFRQRVYAPKYWGMYDTHAFAGFNMVNLNRVMEKDFGIKKGQEIA